MPANPAPPPPAAPAAPEPARRRSRFPLLPLERGWRVAVVGALLAGFAGGFLFAAVRTLTAMRLYQSEVTLKVESRRPLPGDQGGESSRPTALNIMESERIIGQVAERLKVEGQLRAFMAPYSDAPSDDPLTFPELLEENRHIVHQRLTLHIAIQYRHPNRMMAAKVANIFAEEYQTCMQRERLEEIFQTVQELQLRAEQQNRKVNAITNALQKLFS